jgi:hypothetical protein
VIVDKTMVNFLPGIDSMSQSIKIGFKGHGQLLLRICRNGPIHNWREIKGAVQDSVKIKPLIECYTDKPQILEEIPDLEVFLRVNHRLESNVKAQYYLLEMPRNSTGIVSLLFASTTIRVLIGL